MNCPKCDGLKLISRRVGDIDVDHCAHCGGWWMDQSELPRLLELPAAEVKPLRTRKPQTVANSKRGLCPRCRREMLRVSSAVRKQVTVDNCPDCGGVWLDGGEFAQLFDEAHS